MTSASGNPYGVRSFQLAQSPDRRSSKTGMRRCHTAAPCNRFKSLPAGVHASARSVMFTQVRGIISRGDNEPSVARECRTRRSCLIHRFGRRGRSRCRACQEALLVGREANGILPTRAAGRGPRHKPLEYVAMCWSGTHPQYLPTTGRWCFSRAHETSDDSFFHRCPCSGNFHCRDNVFAAPH